MCFRAGECSTSSCLTSILALSYLRCLTSQPMSPFHIPTPSATSPLHPPCCPSLQPLVLHTPPYTLYSPQSIHLPHSYPAHHSTLLTPSILTSTPLLIPTPLSPYPHPPTPRRQFTGSTCQLCSYGYFLKDNNGTLSHPTTSINLGQTPHRRGYVTVGRARV